MDVITSIINKKEKHVESEKKDTAAHWLVIAWAVVGAAIAWFVASNVGIGTTGCVLYTLPAALILGWMSRVMPSRMRGALGAILGGALFALAAKYLCPANLNITWIIILGIAGGVIGRIVAHCNTATIIRLLFALVIGCIIAWTATSMIWMTYNAFMWLSMPGVDLVPYTGPWVHVQICLTVFFVPAMWFHVARDEESQTG